MFVYGSHRYICYLQVYLLDVLGFHYQRLIIWHYENSFSKFRRNLATHYDPLLWVSRTSRPFYRQVREPYASTDRLRYPVNKDGKAWHPHPGGRLAGDVWKYPTLAGQAFADERVDHPTQKPLALADRIVTHFSEPGALVVVPFAGSGTECVSARDNGRGFWGAELNPRYVSLARVRLSSPRPTRGGSRAAPRLDGQGMLFPRAPDQDGDRTP